MSVKVQISKTYPVTGMHCASCASRAEAFVKSLPGVKAASVNYADTSLLVEFSPEDISPSEMKQAIKKIGYDIIIDEDEPNNQPHLQTGGIRRVKLNQMMEALRAVHREKAGL